MGFYLSAVMLLDRTVDRKDDLLSYSMDIVVMAMIFGYSVTNSLQQLIMIHHSIYDVSKLKMIQNLFG